MCIPFDASPPCNTPQRIQFGSHFRGFGIVPRGRVVLDAAAPCQFIGRTFHTLAKLFPSSLENHCSLSAYKDCEKSNPHSKFIFNLPQ